MPTDVAPRPRPRRVVVASPDAVATVVAAVRASHPALAGALADHLRANVRLLRDDELPAAPPDAALAARVAALEADAAALAVRVREARGRLAPRLAGEAARAAAAVTEGATGEARAAVERAAEERRARGGAGAAEKLGAAVEVVGRAKSVGVLGGRVERLRTLAAATRRRAGNVLETMRIIAESNGDEENDTVTISMDGEPLTFSLSGAAQGADTGRPPPAASMAIPTSPDAKAVRRARRPSPPGDPSASPHITPRSKTRRRLLGTPPAAAAVKFRLPR